MKSNYSLLSKTSMAVLIACGLGSSLLAQSFRTEEAPMMRGVTKNIKNGWTVQPVLTVGETNNAGEDVNLLRLNYRVPGIMDGIGAFLRGNYVKVLFNAEMGESVGYTYYLSNGTPLTGARISYADMVRTSRTVKKMGIAYNQVFDRAGKFVTSASQINEGLAPGTNYGFQRFCSGVAVKNGTFGFVRDIFFAGEETSGGQLAALDVTASDLHVVPMAGRAAYENVGPIENFGTNKVAFIIGDDRGPSPLLLYVGEKGTVASGYNPSRPFLKNNGLANGHIFVWVSDSTAVNGERDMSSFKGTGTKRNGKFIKINHFDFTKAGQTGYDALGFATQATQDASAEAVKFFKFTRPEDIASNPYDRTQVVITMTGLASVFGGADTWGDVDIIDFDNADLLNKLQKPIDSIDSIAASIKILYDGDDAGGGQVAGPDFGIRSPDNVEWSKNGYIYINEDKSATAFGTISQVEASVWQIDTASGAISRILEMDRNAVPFKQTDNSPLDRGNWESSGVLDVSDLFVTKPGETLLLLDVEAHSVSSTLIGGSTNLAEGGQLIFASKVFPAPAAATLRTGSTSTAASAEKATGVKLVASPNPSTHQVDLNKTVDVEIYDMNGKLVLKQVKTSSINVSNLNPGTYIIKSNNEEVKIVIE